MNTQTQAGNGNTELAPARSPADIRRAPMVVENDVPILDTGKFEQMQRVALAIAQSSLVPQHLKGNDDRATVANCFRVVNQAVRWGFDPFSVVDETYLVRGKLGYQGKLVAAVVNAKAGLKERLKYTYNDKTGDALEVTVAATFVGEDQVRTVTVRVGDVKTDNGMWTKDPRQKLIYTGATKWARAHCPELILGVLTDDDLDRMGAYHASEQARDVTPPKPTRAEFQEGSAPKPTLYDLIDAQGEVTEQLPSGNLAAKLIDLMTEAGADFHAVYDRHADVLAAEMFKDVREVYARLSAAEIDANKKAADPAKTEPKDEKPPETATGKPAAPPAELVIINASAKKESKQKWLATMTAAVPHHPPAAVAEWWGGCKAVIAECEKVDPAGVKALDSAVNDRLAA